MIKPNMKVGDVFEDGGLLYKVLTVNGDGTYYSTRTEEKLVEEKPVEAKEEVKEEVKKPVARNSRKR
jgi:hypothetical protein